MGSRISSRVIPRLLLSMVLALIGTVLAVTLAAAADPQVAAYSSSPPTTWSPGETKTYSVTVTNNGTETWLATGDNRVRLGVHFGQASDIPHDGWASDDRFVLLGDVAPGASATISVTVTAPPVAGGYVLRHRMVKEGVQWFDQVQKTDMSVGTLPLCATYTSTPPTSWNTDETKSYSVTVTNSGSESWSAGGSNPIRLGVHFGQSSDVPHDGWSADQRIALPHDVAPGASVTLTVNVTAPPAAGSYVLRHRMVQEGAQWFYQVQRTDVTVSVGPPPPNMSRVAAYSSNPPTGWSPSSTKTYFVTVTNTGTEAWNAAGADRVRLGVQFGQPSDAAHDGWATDDRFDLPNDVAPGASVTIAVTVTAPWVAGGYILRHRMVKEGAGWFDQIQKTSVTVGSLPKMASYASTPPTVWNISETKSYSITVTNTGSETWNAAGPNQVRLGVQFGQSSDVPHDGWSTDQRFDLPGDLAPGASATIIVAVTAPPVPGSYVLHHRVLKEGVQWFDQNQKTNVLVFAGPLAASYSSTTPTIWLLGQSQTYSVIITNTGSETWSAGGDNRVRLSVHFGQGSDVAHDGWSTDERFELPGDIAPGASATITVTGNPPAVAGSYVLRHRMVKEGTAWFDQIQKTNVTVYPGLKFASFTSSPATTWTAGETKSYSITITNEGLEAWNATGDNRVRLSVHFGQASDIAHDGWATDERFILPGDIASGASATISVAVTAPGPGSYVLRHRMVKEGIQWFDQQIQTTSVTVTVP